MAVWSSLEPFQGYNYEENRAGEGFSAPRATRNRGKKRRGRTHTQPKESTTTRRVRKRLGFRERIRAAAPPDVVLTERPLKHQIGAVVQGYNYEKTGLSRPESGSNRARAKAEQPSMRFLIPQPNYMGKASFRFPGAERVNVSESRGSHCCPPCPHMYFVWASGHP